MAIAYDSSNSAVTIAGSSLSFSLAATGSNRLAILAVGWASGTYTSPATVTVGGSAATLIVQKDYYSAGRHIALYRYTAPPTSSTTYEVTWGGSVDDASFGAVTYTGVDQTTPVPNSTSSGDENTGTATITIASATGEMVIAAIHTRYPTNGATESGGQTERIYANNWSGNDAVFAVGEEAGATSVTQEWTLTNTGTWAAVAARLSEAATAPTITDAGDESFYNGETGCTISGSGFGSSQGNGTVKISPTNNVNDAGAIAQTVTSWGATSIQFTCVKSTLSFLTNYYLFVTENGGASNATGYQVQIEPRVYIREKLVDLDGNTVNSESGLTAFVWRAIPSNTNQAPAECLTSKTTDADGDIDWQITRGSLVSPNPVWVAIFKDGTPFRATMRKVTPVYE